MNEQQLREIASKYCLKGEDISSDTAYGGEMTDRGGGAMVREAQAFLAGLDKRLPENWRGFVEDLKYEEMREFAEYERLKAKFG